MRNEYSIQKFLRKGKKLKSTEYDVENYIQYVESILSVCPDSVIKVFGYRICYEEECAIYICMAKHEGTMMPAKPFPSPSEWKKTSSKGSFVFYRDRMGKIFRIEYYVELD